MNKTWLNGKLFQKIKKKGTVLYKTAKEEVFLWTLPPGLPSPYILSIVLEINPKNQNSAGYWEKKGGKN